MLLYPNGSCQLLDAIAVADRIRPEAVQAIKSIHALGIQTVLLTGDAKLVAQAIAQELGITDVAADLLPDHKRDRARALVAQGRVVAMVGDGINDACTGRALADSRCRIPHRGRVQLKWQRP